MCVGLCLFVWSGIFVVVVVDYYRVRWKYQAQPNKRLFLDFLCLFDWWKWRHFDDMTINNIVAGGGKGLTMNKLCRADENRWPLSHENIFIFPLCTRLAVEE